MKIIKRVSVPTGDILVVQGEKGYLEMLSIGDYGKDVNVKCDAMGLSRKPSPVKHTDLLPLEQKWVITISTQYGCSIGCRFCDVPIVGPGINATERDLINQVLAGIELHPEVTGTARLNIHFARMGEPTFNQNVLRATEWFKKFLNTTHKIHPVVSTMMPRRNKAIREFIAAWMHIKNSILDGEAGLQLSINSTNDNERTVMFNGNAMNLPEISDVMAGIIPVGRKITLNFALAGYEIDPAILLRYFDPRHYLCKLTPMHKTNRAEAFSIQTDGDYTTYEPYEEDEKALRNAGYDVLVFIASHEEDDSGITCGNAILANQGRSECNDL